MGKRGSTKRSNGAAKLNGQAVNGEGYHDDEAVLDEQRDDGADPEFVGAPTEPAPVPPPAGPPPPLTRFLKCRLNLKEKRAIAKEIVAAQLAIKDLDEQIDQLDEKKKNLRKEREVFEIRTRTKSIEYHGGEARRDVPCRELKNVVNPLVENPSTELGIATIREDTNEPIEWRPLTKSERQGDLFDRASAP